MKQRRAIALTLALGVLLVSPIAWGCEGTGVQDCSMSDCPMTQQQEAEDCHQSAAPIEPDSFACDADPEIWIACCDAPIDQEPAKIDATSSSDHGATPLVILAERLEVQPPTRPPDLASEAISAQQHELGRFTLLSSFLL